MFNFNGKSFVGGKSISTVEQIFVINFIKNLNEETCKYLGFRETKHGELFLIVANSSMLTSYTTSYINGKYEMVKIGSATYSKWESANALYLGIIHVEDKFGHQGIGQKMLDFVKMIAGQMGIEKIMLDKEARYTNGEEVYNDNGSPLNSMLIEQMKKKGKPIVDANEIFYKKNGFVFDTEQETCYETLRPMVLKNPVCYKKPTIGTIRDFFNLNESCYYFEQHVLQLKENLEMEK